MSEPITLGSANGVLPFDLFAAICAIHDRVFSQPPFTWAPDSSQENADDLRRLADDPTFEVVVAQWDTTVVGYAFGHRLPPDHGWWRAVPEPLPPLFTREWEGRTFTLTSLAVLPEWRRRGIGEKLIDRLLKGRTEERAILSVQPAATETQAFYKSSGWRWVARNGPLPGVTPPRWDIYVLEDLPRFS